MFRLYEFPKAYEELMSEIADCQNESDTGELTEEDSAHFKSRFDSLEIQLNAKIENIAKLVKSLEASRDALKDEADRLASRARATAKKIEWLKGYAIETMVGLGVPKVEGTVLTIGMSSHERVLIEDEDVIPEQFVVTTVGKRTDKTAIKDAINNGENVPGASLVSRNALRIK